MWRCSNCCESVEDSFDRCWNCGAARDGTVDPDFEPVPDDPSVPDPGDDSPPESDAVATARATSSGTMNRRELAGLICKTLGLILFAVAAVLSVTVVVLLFVMTLAGGYGRSFDSQDFSIFLIAAVPVLAIVGVGILYWTKSDWIARRMVSANPRPIGNLPFTLQDATTVAFSTVGLIFFFDGIRDVIGLIYIAQEYSMAGSELWYESRTWSALIRLSLSIWLILGSRGIVGVIHRLRTAGIPPREDETEDETSEGGGN